MQQMNAPRRRVHSLIRGTVAGMSGDIKAPRVVNLLMLKHWTELYEDRDACRHLMTLGLNHEVRPILSQYDDGPVSEDQDRGQASLDLWSPGERHIARQIGDVRAFVLSRGAHVILYDREQITPDEVAEAGAYLITHGHGCVRQGNYLLALAAQRRRIAVTA
jgi:hypothetical protein